MIRIPPPPTTPSFEKSAKPLLLALEPSRSWFVLLVVLHMLCVVAVFIAAIATWIKLALVAVIATSFVYHYKLHINPAHLVWRNGNRWFVNDVDAVWELSSIGFFSRWLIILSLTPINPDKQGFIARYQRTKKFIIPFDALDEERFRLLRVRLKIEGFELLNPVEEEWK